MILQIIVMTDKSNEHLDLHSHNKTVVLGRECTGNALRRTLQLTQRKRKTSQMETSVNEVKVTKKDIERYPG